MASRERPPMLVRASNDIARALAGQPLRRAPVQRGDRIDPAPGLVIDTEPGDEIERT